MRRIRSGCICSTRRPTSRFDLERRAGESRVAAQNRTTEPCSSWASVRSIFTVAISPTRSGRRLRYMDHAVDLRRFAFAGRRMRRSPSACARSRSARNSCGRLPFGIGRRRGGGAQFEACRLEYRRPEQGRNRDAVWHDHAGAGNRREPRLDIALLLEVFYGVTVRAVTGDRMVSHRAHHGRSLVFLRELCFSSQTETRSLHPLFLGFITP